MSDLRVTLRRPSSAAARSSRSAAISIRRCSSASSERLFARGAALRGTRARGARSRRLLRAAAGRRRPRPDPHAASGVELISNVCRHRQAVMLRGRGNTAREHRLPAAPLDLRPEAAELIGAPHFADDPCLQPAQLPGADLERHGVRSARAGSGRDVAAELAGIGPTADLDFTGYASTASQLHECDYNWKTFIEVYLEDYHVAPFHPGLGQFVTCEDLRWEFGAHHSVQTVGREERAGQAGLAGLPEVARRGARLPRRRTAPKHGAIWLTYYPAVMVEWYPHVLVVSTLHPEGPAEDAQRRRVLLPRGDRRLRARVRRGRAGGVLGDLRRRRRDRAAHGRRPARPVRARRRRGRPVPEPDGRRHAAVPRVVPPQRFLGCRDSAGVQQPDLGGHRGVGRSHRDIGHRDVPDRRVHRADEPGGSAVRRPGRHRDALGDPDAGR